MIRWAIVVCLLASCRDAPPAAKPKPAPTITGLLPTEVTTLGFRLGSVEGDGFDPKARVKVFFGATEAPRAAVVGKTKIQVEIPPGTAGSEVPVRVEIEGYEPALSPTKMRYIDAEHDHDDESP